MSCKVSDVKPARKSFLVADILECQKRWTEPHNVEETKMVQDYHIESNGPPSRDEMYNPAAGGYSWPIGFPIEPRHFVDVDMSPYYQIYPHMFKSKTVFLLQKHTKQSALS